MNTDRRLTIWGTLLSPFGLSLLIAAIGVGVLVLPFGQTLEAALGLELLFKQRGARAVPSEVVVVSIEKNAARDLGLSNRPDRWPRALHARLVDRLHTAGAAVIVFDVHFKEARDSTGDAAFAAALQRAGNVILFAYLDRESMQPHVDLERLIPPLASLSTAAAAIAPFALPKLPVRVNRFWTFLDSAGGMAALPMAALEIYSLSALPALAAILQQHDSEAAARLHSALADSSATARVVTRELLQRVSPAEWDALHRVLDNDTATRIQALYHAYRTASHPYLNFYGPPGHLTPVSYADVIRGDDQTLAAQFKGKAVFVGFAEQSQTQQSDNFYTVFSQEDGQDLSGVEIAATAFANLLHRDTLQPPDNLAALLLVLGYGFLIATLCRRLPAVAAISVGLTVAVIYYYVAGKMFEVYYHCLPLITPLFVQTPLALFFGVFGHYCQGQRERRQLRHTFGHYVPEHVIDRVLSHTDGLRAPGELLYGICLATDAALYTQLAETMSPAQLNKFMNEYYEALFAPVLARQGMISDVVGDAMLAIWSGPQSNGMQRTQALDAALGIRDAVAEFGRRPARPPLPTRIGLHCGELVMGNVGALEHFEYRAVGDIVNTANRIQSLNKQLGTHLLASAGVVEGIENIVTRPLGQYLLAGKQQSVTIHEVIGHAGEIDERQRAFYVRFASALALFSQGQWQPAAAAFAALSHEKPKDGPCRFFVMQCARYAAAAPANWRGVLTLAEK